jgi:hypothetical protein
MQSGESTLCNAAAQTGGTLERERTLRREIKKGAENLHCRGSSECFGGRGRPASSWRPASSSSSISSSTSEMSSSESSALDFFFFFLGRSSSSSSELESSSARDKHHIIINAFIITLALRVSSLRGRRQARSAAETRRARFAAKILGSDTHAAGRRGKRGVLASPGGHAPSDPSSSEPDPDSEPDSSSPLSSSSSCMPRQPRQLGDMKRQDPPRPTRARNSQRIHSKDGFYH